MGAGRSRARSTDRAVPLLSLLARELASHAPTLAGDAQVDGDEVVAVRGRLRLEAAVRDASPDRAHAHVVASLGQERLDACVLGLGPSPEAALAQVAHVWTIAAGSPILSVLAGQAVLSADRFDGSEAWGIPGGDGFVGPFACRGGEVDLEALAEAPAFAFGRYPTDGLHLVKVTLLGLERRWQRHVEIDGHWASHVDDEYDLGLAVPPDPVMCVRFAAVSFGAGGHRSH